MAKNVDQILKGFNKTISELRKLADRNSREISDNTDLIERLNTQNTVMTTENARALAVVEKLEALLS